MIQQLFLLESIQSTIKSHIYVGRKMQLSKNN